MTRNEFIKIEEDKGFDSAVYILERSGNTDLESEMSLVEHAKNCLDNDYYADALEIVEALAHSSRSGYYRYGFCGEPTSVDEFEDIEDLLEEDDDEEE